MQLSAIRPEMVTDVVNGNTNTSPNGDVISSFEADSVAKAFVRQFYTTITENRPDVQKYYGHGSLVQADEKIIIGQQEIANYYTSLLPEKVKVKINSITGTPTLHNGILVKALGFVNHRPFAQSFLLGKQCLKKYYVENDVLVFIDSWLETENLVIQPKSNGAVSNGKQALKSEETQAEAVTPKKNVVTPKKAVEEVAPQKQETPRLVEKSPEPIRQAPTPKQAPVQPPKPSNNEPIVNIRQEQPKPKTWATLFQSGETKPAKNESVPVHSQQRQVPEYGRWTGAEAESQQVPRDTHPQTPNANRNDVGSLAERKIYLGGITRSIVPDSTATAETEITTLFYQFGEVENVSIPRKVLESPNDMSKTAFAFITMRNLQAARRVFESAVKDENGVYQLKLKIDAFGFDGTATISEQKERPFNQNSFRGRGGFQSRGGFQPRGRGGPSGNRGGFRGGFQNNRLNGQH